MTDELDYEGHSYSLSHLLLAAARFFWFKLHLHFVGSQMAIASSVPVYHSPLSFCSLVGKDSCLSENGSTIQKNKQRGHSTTLTGWWDLGREEHLWSVPELSQLDKRSEMDRTFSFAPSPTDQGPFFDDWISSTHLFESLRVKDFSYGDSPLERYLIWFSYFSNMGPAYLMGHPGNRPTHACGQVLDQSSERGDERILWSSVVEWVKSSNLIIGKPTSHKEGSSHKRQWYTTSLSQ